MSLNLGVPMVGIGDELPNFVGETPSGMMDVHEWITEGQTYKEGEEIFCIVFTFPSLENPVVVSEFEWLGKPETLKEFETRKLRVLAVVTATLYQVQHFLKEVPDLIETEEWSLDGMSILADESGEYQRMLGGVRPGAADAVKGRVPSSTTLVISPRIEVVYRTDYPITTGRNFFELLRVFDSLQISHHFPRLGTWANWQPGGQEGCLIMPSPEDGSLLNDEECAEMFPKGKFECLFPWFRITPVPDIPGQNDEEDTPKEGPEG